MVLHAMQSLLGRLYDLPIDYEIGDFLVTDRRCAAAIAGVQLNSADEHVFIAEKGEAPHLCVYIDESVLSRLARHDPMGALNESNLSDFCTAFEGVSHFQYLIWSLQRGRTVSLLELELQAEIDKYVAALILRMSQESGRFPGDLHSSLFLRVGFLAELDEESLQRYREASRCAAYFCRALDERYWLRRRRRPEAWLAAIRNLYRYGHHEKLRRAAAV